MGSGRRDVAPALLLRSLDRFDRNQARVAVALEVLAHGASGVARQDARWHRGQALVLLREPGSIRVPPHPSKHGHERYSLRTRASSGPWWLALRLRRRYSVDVRGSRWGRPWGWVLPALCVLPACGKTASDPSAEAADRSGGNAGSLAGFAGEASFGGVGEASEASEAGTGVGAEPGCGDSCLVRLATGNVHTCGLRRDGSIVCVGSDRYGQADPPPDETFTDIAAGGFSTCGLTVEGAAQCWGSGEHADPPEETFVELDAGSDLVCGVTSNPATICWGEALALAPARFDAVEEVAVGSGFACGLRKDGTAQCWGDNLFGQAEPPPDETFVQLTAGAEHACGLKSNATVVCWGSDGFGQLAVLTVLAGEQFVQVEAGGYHTCGLRDDGSVLCWGRNNAGQIDAPSNEVFTELAAAGMHTCGLRPTGDARCWGSNEFGQSAPLP